MISITIPTKSSASTLPRCLDSVRQQVAGDDVEVLVIDARSADGTADVARAAGAAVLLHNGALLGARRLGFSESKGDIVVLLDSDQVLRPGALSRARKLIEDGAGMVVLGERVWSPRTLVERLSDLDKQLLARDITTQLHPRHGVLLPRVFRRDALAAGFASIPTSIDDICIAHDHAILYWECSRDTNSVAYLADAVWHIEPDSVIKLWRKNYRYGWSTRELLATGLYRDLIKDKTRRRALNERTPLRLRAASAAFLALKAPAYFAGYSGAIRRTSRRRNG
jgi:glycosyltransferase involved in cell wall biosynthesis